MALVLSDGGGSPLLRRICLLALFCGFESPLDVLAASPDEPNVVPQAVEYIWPMAVFSFPLLDPADKSLERLVSIAETGYKRYLEEILPKELSIDPGFKEEFESTESSRVGVAFLRWQKRAFAVKHRVLVDELNWDGKPVPKYQGVSYEWKELYESDDFQTLKRKIEGITSSYFKQLNNDYRKQKMRTFIWAEPYRQGEWQRPHEHTGAAAAGMITARHHQDDQGHGQIFTMKDPRGHFPPFGQTHDYSPVVGEVLIWPSWGPHLFDANPANRTNFYFSFLVWPHGGAPELDWEDDMTGDIVYRKTTQVKKADPAPPRDEL